MKSSHTDASKKFKAATARQDRLIAQEKICARQIDAPGLSEDDDAYFYRRLTNADLAEKLGRIPRWLFNLTNARDWELKESIAVWLRRELRVLRNERSKPGASPVRRQRALSELQIADVAADLLEGLCGAQLTWLFQELLDIDRHRNSIAQDLRKMNEAAQREAVLRVQGVVPGVNRLATLCSVAGSSVSRWRKMPKYNEWVSGYVETWKGLLQHDYFPEIEKQHPQATEAEKYMIAVHRYSESLPERQARLTGKASSGAARSRPPRRRKRF